MVETCLNCQYCHTGDTDIKTLKKEAYCVRFPPTANLLPTQHGVVNMTAYPSVNDKTFLCGEFKPNGPTLLQSN